MATRTVALDTESYELLRRNKRPDESFSDVVKRLAKPRRPLTDFAGIWKDMSPKERAEMDRIYGALREADRRRAELLRRAWG